MVSPLLRQMGKKQKCWTPSLYLVLTELYLQSRVQTSVFPPHQMSSLVNCFAVRMKSRIYSHHWMSASRMAQTEYLPGYSNLATAFSIAPAVIALFNLSLKLGRVPLCWKRSSVVPIPKIPAAKSPDYYRLISLLSILSKDMSFNLSLSSLMRTVLFLTRNGDSGLVVPRSLQCYPTPPTGLSYWRQERISVPYSLFLFFFH